ncbi:MAG: aminopeptidase P N-terminal domain-containing protein [Chthonomonadales bacterium]
MPIYNLCRRVHLAAFAAAIALLPAGSYAGSLGPKVPLPIAHTGKAPARIGSVALQSLTEEYAARRAALRSQFPGDIIILSGPGDNSDVGRVRFRTSNSLMYLTGVEAPDACLVLLPDGDPTNKHEILFLPDQTPSARRWSDPLPTPGEETQRATGIEAVLPLANMWNVLEASLLRAKRIRVEGPVLDQRPAAAGLLPDGSSVNSIARYYPNGTLEHHVKTLNPGVEFAGGVREAIARLRRTKSPSEVAKIQAAVAATAAAEEAAAHNVKPGVDELTIEGIILAEFRRHGAVREAFPCIVGSGPNSTVLHHFASQRRMQSGETVVVDIGAEFDYYAADLTRTFPVGGRFTPRQRALYRLVLECQEDAARFARPGMTMAQVHNHAVQFLRSSPLRARDLDGREYTMDHFFIHGLGHFLGMDVHDVTGGSASLDPGVVFTIEPGVYIPSEGIGIRIEDDYLMTPAGARKLSAALPSDPAEIEALMRSASRQPGGLRRSRVKSPSRHALHPRGARSGLR